MLVNRGTEGVLQGHPDVDEVLVKERSIDNAGIERPPDPVAMTGVADGRIHLCIGAEALVAVRRHQGQVVDQHFDRGEVGCTPLLSKPTGSRCT